MSLKNLSKIIPIFPLSNFIIFPKTTVPLNIFEPRYIEMVNNSMRSDKLIGIVQPKKSKDIVFTAAARTAIGRYKGMWSKQKAHNLGEAVIRNILSKSKVEPKFIDEIILYII